MSKSTHIWILLLAAGLSLSATAAARSEAILNPLEQLTKQVGIYPVLGTPVPLELEFVNADGKSVRLADLMNDKPVLLHLVYYECPMLCRLSSDGMMAGLAAVSLEPGKDFSIITVSFDPREGPELSRRARALAIDRIGREPVESGWQFLTGTESAIAKLCDSVGFKYAWDDKTSQYAHASGVFALTPDGKLSRFLSGVEFSPRDLRLSLVEASENKIGTAADQVLLMCYMYDPTTGKYGFAVISAIRALGVATVGVMAASIFVMLRRERQRSEPSRDGRGQGEGESGLGTHLPPALSSKERED
jgi:protein SCO1/2